MYLSDRDLLLAIQQGRLIVDPFPEGRIESTSIDLRLDAVNEAKVWDMERFQKDNEDNGNAPLELRVGKFKRKGFSRKYQVPVSSDTSRNVFRRDREIVVKPNGFLLWQTKERVGTPQKDADLICFIDGKSTRARTGLLVHMTAPTIHSSWAANITLEIANLGPFHFVLLQEDDVIAQITVAQITRPPRKDMSGGATFGKP